VLAHTVFLGLPWSALWGGLAMSAVVIVPAVQDSRAVRAVRV
jgi:hypothetical protein